jgi:hypothetical protein
MAVPGIAGKHDPRTVYATRKLSGCRGTWPYNAHPTHLPASVGGSSAACRTSRRGATRAVFFLGLGTGENLNEHIVAEGWPEVEVRQERLAEAIQIIRLLWKGELSSSTESTSQCKTCGYTAGLRSLRP